MTTELEIRYVRLFGTANSFGESEGEEIFDDLPTLVDYPLPGHTLTVHCGPLPAWISAIRKRSLIGLVLGAEHAALQDEKYDCYIAVVVTRRATTDAVLAPDRLHWLPEKEIERVIEEDSDQRRRGVSVVLGYLASVLGRRHFQKEQIGRGTYFFAEGMRPFVYGKFRGHATVLHSQAQNREEIQRQLTKLQHLKPQLTELQQFSTPFNAYLSALQTADPVQRFLLLFLTLEMIAGKVISVPPPRRPLSIQQHLAEIPNPGRLNLSQKFWVTAKWIRPASSAADCREFGRLKRIRDREVAHGQVDDPHNLPLNAAEELSGKYVAAVIDAYI